MLYLIDGDDSRDRAEKFGLSMAIGMGIIGWLGFWLGVAGSLNKPILFSLLLVLSTGIFLLFRERPVVLVPNPENRIRRELSENPALIWTLCAIASLAFLFDLAEGGTTPLDADTLAYHFQIPKEFSDLERIEFIPAAFSGAIPLLLHMTYTIAYALGEEPALTGWTLSSGWFASILFFLLLKRWLTLPWALATALIFQTLPAMTFGAGSGQVEARLAAFAMIAVIGFIDITDGKNIRPVILSGIGAGFFMAAKLSGVFFVAALAVGVVIRTKNLWLAAMFLAIACIVGGQWYVWNFIHTGDPFFPFLFKYAQSLNLANLDYWNSNHLSTLTSSIETRRQGVGINHLWFMYPIEATFWPLPSIQSGRIGLGPYYFFLLPMALCGVWVGRSRIIYSKFCILFISILIFYGLLMSFGSIPKVRHFLPIIPVVLLCMTISSLSVSNRELRLVLWGAVFLTLISNLSVQFLYSLPYLKHHVIRQNKSDLLKQNLVAYPAVMEVNARTNIDYLFLWDRQLRYHINARTFFAAPNDQALIESRTGLVKAPKFYKQLVDQNITHLLLRTAMGKIPNSVSSSALVLERRGCLELQTRIDYERFSSRTLKDQKASHMSLDLWSLDYDCDPSNLKHQ